MIDISAQAMEEAKKSLEQIPGGIDRATRAAVNKTIRGVRTDIVTEIRANYVVKSQDIRRTLTLSIASRSNARAVVKSMGKPIALSKFKVRPGKVQRRGSKNKPIRVQVKKDGGGVLSNAFLAQFKSGHLGVVERKGKARFPVEEFYGPPIPKMLKNQEILNTIEDKAHDRLEKNFTHEIVRIWKGYGS